MRVEFSLPDFKELKPIKLEKLSKKMESGEYVLEPSKADFGIIVRKIKNKQQLNYREHQIALLSYEQLIDLEIDKIYRILLRRYFSAASSTRRKRTYSSAITYLFPIYYYRTSMRTLLMLNELYESGDRYKEFQDYFKDGWEVGLNRFVRDLEEQNFDAVYQRVFRTLPIEKNSKFICEAIYKLSYKVAFDDLFCILVLDLENVLMRHERIFAGIFDSFLKSLYPQIDRLEEIDDFKIEALRIFKKYFGEIGKKGIWGEMSVEAIAVYKRWLLLNKFLSHFEELIDTVDRVDRMEFWKSYFYYFKNIEYYDDYNSALVMETEHHTIIEFNGHGGGRAFFYTKEKLNIKIINESAKHIIKSVMKDIRLKDKGKAINSMIHTPPNSGWYNKFHRYMQSIGYERRF